MKDCGISKRLLTILLVEQYKNHHNVVRPRSEDASGNLHTMLEGLDLGSTLLLMCTGRQKVMAQVLGFSPPRRETWVELSAPTFKPRAQPVI